MLSFQFMGKFSVLFTFHPCLVGWVVMIIVQFAAARKYTDNEPSTRLQRNSCASCLER